MKIAISSTEKGKDALADKRFGRCPYFVIFDTETKEIKSLENKGVMASEGAGVAAAQQILDEKVSAVITGYVGPNAMQILNAEEIKIYQGHGISIEEEIKLFQEEELKAINKPGPAHFGMKNQHRRGC
jgi:predicted Fe-Mo cluster-binding NifX family protein